MNTSRLIIIGVLALAGSMAAAAETRIDERRPAAADGVVEVSNVSGSVQLVGWNRNEVALEGTLADGVERVEFSGSDGLTRIRVHLVRPDNDERHHRIDGNARLVIRVPERSRMRVNTVSAGIQAERLNGPLELRSVSGDIRAAGGYTEADLQSVSGRVQVASSGRSARVTAGSISGDVQVDGMTGELTGSTVSGTVRVATDGISRAHLKSISGEVAYEGPLAADGVYELEAVSGTARMVVTGRVNAHFELHTFNGAIRNGFGPPPERTSRYAPGQSLNFDEGRGGARVSMRSMSGTLRLDRR